MSIRSSTIKRIYTAAAGVGLAIGSAAITASASSVGTGASTGSAQVAQSTTIGASAPTSATRATAPDSARGARAVSCYVSRGNILRGCAGFYPTGDALSACDYSNDRRVVYGQLYWSGRIRMGVVDLNGKPTGCGIQQLDGSIAEGTVVFVRACVSGLGCSPWKRGVA